MEIFTLPNDYQVVCNTANTRHGFKHTATLCHNYHDVHSTKICYLSRTWERFTYESVLKKVVEEGIDLHPEIYLDAIKEMRG